MQCKSPESWTIFSTLCLKSNDCVPLPILTGSDGQTQVFFCLKAIPFMQDCFAGPEACPECLAALQHMQADLGQVNLKQAFWLVLSGVLNN